MQNRDLLLLGGALLACSASLVPIKSVSERSSLARAPAAPVRFEDEPRPLAPTLQATPTAQFEPAQDRPGDRNGQARG